MRIPFTLTSEGRQMKSISGVVAVLGIDLAKRVFALHGVDAAGKTVLKQVIPRSAFNRVIAQLPPCLIGLEACSGAHEWARQFQTHGHTVKLIAPSFVTPYRKSGKNDDNDAEAICEAVGRPNMRFVPVKTRDQQALLSLHRVRQGFVEERTALINRLRGLLAEFGFVFAQRHGGLREIPAAAEGLPALAKRAVDDLLDHLRQLNQRIASYDTEFQRLAKQDDAAKRIMTIPGVGPITALGMVATLGNARDFKNGRQLAAWLGLTPRQHSSGGKMRLGGVTKRGDDYLRTLLVQGARAAMQHASRAEPTRLSRWAANLVARRGYHKANIALAAKNARIVWAILARGGEFEARAAAA
jgi:transposase